MRDPAASRPGISLRHGHPLSGLSVDRARLEAACDRALAIGAVSCSSVNAILKAGLDEIQPAAEPVKPTSLHGNIRSGSYH